MTTSIKGSPHPILSKSKINSGLRMRARALYKGPRTIGTHPIAWFHDFDTQQRCESRKFRDFNKI